MQVFQGRFINCLWQGFNRLSRARVSRIHALSFRQTRCGNSVFRAEKNTSCQLDVQTRINQKRFYFVPELVWFPYKARCSKIWRVSVFNHKNMVFLYALASLNFTLSVSEYVTTIVTAKPVTFLREPNPCCTVVSHMCSCKTITVSRKYPF